MTSRLLALPLVRLPFALACGDKEGDDTGSDGSWTPHCDATETPLAFDEASPLGFSAADLAAALGSEVVAELSWTAPDSAASLLTLSLAWTSDVVFVDLEEATPPDDATSIPDIGVICDDYLSVGVTLGLASADGLLAESFAVDMVASAADAASFWLEAAEADFSHPEIFAPFKVAEATEEHPVLSGSVSAGGNAQGEIAWVAQGSNESTAWQSSDPVATWQADGE